MSRPEELHKKLKPSSPREACPLAKQRVFTMAPQAAQACVDSNPRSILDLVPPYTLDIAATEHVNDGLGSETYALFRDGSYVRTTRHRRLVVKKPKTGKVLPLEGSTLRCTWTGDHWHATFKMDYVFTLVEGERNLVRFTVRVVHDSRGTDEQFLHPLTGKFCTSLAEVFCTGGWTEMFTQDQIQKKQAYYDELLEAIQERLPLMLDFEDSDWESQSIPVVAEQVEHNPRFVRNERGNCVVLQDLQFDKS